LVKKNKTISPSSIESFDDYSLKLAFRFASDFIGQLGLFGALRLGLRFIPELFMMIRTGIPKLILMTEVTGNNQDELLQTLQGLRADIKKEYGYISRVTYGAGAEKYWRIRRESFNLLRKHVQGLHTAPFIDDVVVPIEYLPEFLPQITQILERERFIYTIAGHAGNGNFHIIPLMDLHDKNQQDIIPKLSKEVFDLVISYKGSNSGEHNDGLIRTPFLEDMYGKEIVTLFEATKDIFDPQGIFNPRKKVRGDIQFAMQHIRQSW
jgi:FAD/FMN-containing dehydrogenase